jgi:hypothetical protein
MRDLVVEVQLAEPSVTEVQLDLLAEAALMTDTVAVPDNQHPDHKFRIDRRSADVAVKRSQLLVKIVERGGDKAVHPSQQVAPWNHFVEVEIVEQPSLIPILSPQHPESPAGPSQQESAFAASVEPFFDSIDPKRTSL